MTQVVDVATSKDIAVRWLTALFSGDVPEFRALTHPEFESVISGDMPFCGRRDLREFIAMMSHLRSSVFAPGPFEMHIGQVTAEDDRVYVEAEGRIPLRNGKLYNNFYILGLVVREGRVVQMKESMDTLHVHRVFEGEEFAGEKQRVNVFYDEPIKIVRGVNSDQ